MTNTPEVPKGCMPDYSALWVVGVRDGMVELEGFDVDRIREEARIPHIANIPEPDSGKYNRINIPDILNLIL